MSPQIAIATYANNMLRRYLRSLPVPVADFATLKCIRAGKATALAMAGCSVPDMLKSGEWRGACAISYIDAARVDQAQLLRQNVDDCSVNIEFSEVSDCYDEGVYWFLLLGGKARRAHMN